MNLIKVKTGTIEELTKDEVLCKENQQKMLLLDEMLKKNPNNTEALLKKAFLFFQDHVDGKAIEIYKHIININPKCIDAYVWLAELYIFQWSEAEKAKEVLEQALKINPYNRADLYYLMSCAYASRENKTEEIKYLVKTIQLEPSWLTPRWLLVGCLIDEKNFTLAKEVLEESYNYIDEKFPIPKDDMKWYYETLITGNANGANIKKYLDKYQKIIDENLMK